MWILDSELLLIWASRWNLVKALFLLVRCTPFIDMILIIFCKCFPQRWLHCDTDISPQRLTRNGTPHTACGVTFKTSALTFRVFPSPFGCADLLRLQGCLLSAPAWLRVSSLARPLASLLRAPQSTSHHCSSNVLSPKRNLGTSDLCQGGVLNTNFRIVYDTHSIKLCGIWKVCIDTVST